MSGLRRLFQIGLAVSGYLLWWLLVRLHLWRPSVTPAQRLCRTFERLGATFVKLGQGLSLHRDLLPDAALYRAAPRGDAAAGGRGLRTGAVVYVASRAGDFPLRKAVMETMGTKRERGTRIT